MKPIQKIITQLAETKDRPPSRPFGINASDRLFHQYIIGQTGTGKSTLLLQMMQQDWANGQGFCLVDQHGDLSDSLVKLCPDATILAKQFGADIPGARDLVNLAKL